MSDLNYNIMPQNPLPGMMQALQFGQAIGGMRDQRAMAAQQAEDARLAAEKQKAREAQMSEMFNLVHKEPTAENYARLASMMPASEAESIRKNFTMMDEAAQQATLAGAGQVFAAFKSGNPQIALSLLEEKAQAYRNANNEQGAQLTQSLIDMAKTGDKGMQAAEDYFGLMLGVTPGGKDVIESIGKFGDEQRSEQLQPAAMEQALADIGLTKAQTNKLLVELERSKAGGTMDPEQAFSSELQLNKEYTTRARGYEEALRTNNIIMASANDASGAGDLALITAFNKMLDPAGVVRESDFAMAQDTGGLVAKLAAALGRVRAGEVLMPEQRQDFVRLANEYMKASTEHEQRIRAGLTNLVNNYGLNPDNVFGTMAGTGTAARTTGTTGTTGTVPATGGTTGTTGMSTLEALKAYAKSKWPDETARIDAFTTEAELRAAYKNTSAAFDRENTAPATATQATASSATRTVEVDY